MYSRNHLITKTDNIKYKLTKEAILIGQKQYEIYFDSHRLFILLQCESFLGLFTFQE